MESPELATISVEISGREGARLRWSPTPDPEGSRSAWQLESEPDWRLLDSVRLVSASFDDGAALGVAALRPRDARGHGDDVVIARLLDAEGGEKAMSEALVSVEYDSAGAPRRLGLELWTDPDSSATRVAADRGEAATSPEPGRDATPMQFRLDGIGGTGLLEVLSPR